MIAPEWTPPPPPTDLIFDDGEPLETNRHRIAMNVLIRSVQQALSDRTDFFVGGNMFVYYSENQSMNRDFRGPDFFVVLDVDGSRERQGWVVWQEEGRYPNVIVELLSSSTAQIDKGVKKSLYEQTFRTPDYFVFDPFDPDSLQGWTLDPRHGYQPLSPNSQGWLWCDTLQLWLGTWQGAIDREPPTDTCDWLRFYTPEGNLVLLPEEVAQQRAEEAEQQARQAEEQARQAEEQARQAEEQAKQAEEQARQAEQQLEAERQLREALLEKLRQQGINPDSL
jgi:Uma2 family endonuclease